MLLLASFGYDAFGLEISEAAARAAEKLAREEGGKGEYAVKDERVGLGKVKFVVGDFFGDEWVESVLGDDDGFDVLYDYTVCCLNMSYQNA